MAIEAKVICDSISPSNVRLTTLQLKYPKFIHGEFMTHRVFTRNASSSRAIPVQRIIAMLEEDPAMPVYWGLNQKGMQARQEADFALVQEIEADWLKARDQMIAIAESLMVKYNLHKQLVNRLLEPWTNIYTVVTATEWENFFNLRRHPDAQPEIHALADCVWEAMEASTPQPLYYGEWHLPYVLEEEMTKHHGNYKTLVKISTARCARVSYKTHDGFTPKPDEDIGLHDTLRYSGHMSPLEHPATPMRSAKRFHGNFRGWKQYRKMISGEAVFHPEV